MVSLDMWLSEALNPDFPKLLRMRAAAFWRLEPVAFGENAPVAKFDTRELGALLGRFVGDEWVPLPPKKVSIIITDCKNRSWFLEGSNARKLIVNPQWIEQRRTPGAKDRALPPVLAESIKRSP